jgi:ion channel-forming bestrophin family protein
MIVSQKLPQLLMLIRGLERSLLVLLGWDFLIVIGYTVMHLRWVSAPSLPLAFYGVAIGIVVGFRNSAAYGRWWEARTLWGAIVNKSRTLARQVLTTMQPEANATAIEQAELAAVQRQLVLYQVAYVHALRQQLRGLDPLAAVAHLLPAGDAAKLAGEKNLALTLQRQMSDMLVAARERGWLNQWEWQAIDGSMSGLMDAQGGAERIKNTPMPKQFEFFPRFFVEIYCVMLPVGLVESLGWFTPLGSTLVGFMFLALDKIGDDLEEPFENCFNDVPITAIATTIEINLRQLLGETELPPAEQPIHGVLW